MEFDCAPIVILSEGRSPQSNRRRHIDVAESMGASLRMTGGGSAFVFDWSWMADCRGRQSLQDSNNFKIGAPSFASLV